MNLHAVTSEFDLHVFVTSLLKLYATTDAWYHVPNGEYRSPRTGARLKKLGVRKGIPDFAFVIPDEGRAAFMELKRADGRLSADQRTVRDNLLDAGALYAVARTPEEAALTLYEWGVISENPVADRTGREG